MDWKVYKDRYAIFISSIGGSGVLAHIGSLFLMDFPHRLPSGLRDFVCEGMTKILKSMKKRGKDGKIVTRKALDLSIPDINQEKVLLEYCLWLAVGSQAMVPSFHFPWHVFSRSQQLVMIFAYFDAFFSDCIIAICNLRPEVLRRKKKQITWKETLNHQNNIRQYLAEIYVNELCRYNIPKRLQILQTEIPLESNITLEDPQFVKYAELIRHLIVHTGGRVTPEFLKRAGNLAEELKIGDFVNIDSNFLNKISYCILTLGSDLFYIVSTQFYRKNVDEIAPLLKSNKWT